MQDPTGKEQVNSGDEDSPGEYYEGDEETDETTNEEALEKKARDSSRGEDTERKKPDAFPGEDESNESKASIGPKTPLERFLQSSAIQSSEKKKEITALAQKLVNFPNATKAYFNTQQKALYDLLLTDKDQLLLKRFIKAIKTPLTGNHESKHFHSDTDGEEKYSSQTPLKEYLEGYQQTLFTFLDTQTQDFYNEEVAQLKEEARSILASIPRRILSITNDTDCLHQLDQLLNDYSCKYLRPEAFQDVEGKALMIPKLSFMWTQFVKNVFTAVRDELWLVALIRSPVMATLKSNEVAVEHAKTILQQKNNLHSVEECVKFLETTAWDRSLSNELGAVTWGDQRATLSASGLSQENVENLNKTDFLKNVFAAVKDEKEFFLLYSAPEITRLDVETNQKVYIHARKFLACKNLVKTSEEFQKFITGYVFERTSLRIFAAGETFIGTIQDEIYLNLFLNSPEIKKLSLDHRTKIETLAKSMIADKNRLNNHSDTFEEFEKKIRIKMRAINKLIIANDAAQLELKYFLGALLGVACVMVLGLTLSAIVAAASGTTLGMALIAIGVTKQSVIVAAAASALIGASAVHIAAEKGYCFGLFKPVPAQANFDKDLRLFLKP